LIAATYALLCLLLDWPEPETQQSKGSFYQQQIPMPSHPYLCLRLSHIRARWECEVETLESNGYMQRSLEEYIVPVIGIGTMFEEANPDMYSPVLPMPSIDPDA
jgi:hypothetical protein